MDFPILSVFFLLASGHLARDAYGRLKTEKLSTRWPTTQANVIELPPTTLFEENFPSPPVFNTDSDYFLSWSVDGKAYRRKLDDTAFITISGFKIWRKPPKTEPVHLYYNPDDPHLTFQEEERGVWRWLSLASFVFFIAAPVSYFM